jgi:hypothetical protein
VLFGASFTDSRINCSKRIISYIGQKRLNCTTKKRRKTEDEKKESKEENQTTRMK